MTQLSDFAVGGFLFTMLAFTSLCMLLVLFHIRTQRELLMTLEELSKEQLDGFSRLMQTTLLHLRAATPLEAVQLQASLEREQAGLDQTIQAFEQGLEDLGTRVEPTKKYIGYKGADGKFYKFMTPPDPSFLVGVDKSRLVEAP